MDHSIFNFLGIIFFLAMVSQWLAWKFRFPVIILLTLSGILAGPVFNLLDPQMMLNDLFHPLVELAVAIILFEGGLNLKLHEFKKGSKTLVRLFSIGVLLNWTLGALFAHYIGGLALDISFLISGILVVTGPTVIIPALRETKLQPDVSRYLRWEAIINDPVGAILAVLTTQFILKVSDFSLWQNFLVIFFTAMGISITVRQVLQFFNQRAMIPEFLKIPFFISTVLLLYIISENIQKGSGLLTTTMLGILVGNMKTSSSKELRRFGESITVFTVAIIFILLAASLKLETWKLLDWRHYLVILGFAFLIRPTSIILSTQNSGISFRERLFIGLYGPRGIVAASVAGVTGTQIFLMGHADGEIILPIIFSVIVTTVVVHSLYMKPLAKKLGLVVDKENGIILAGASRWAIQLGACLKGLGVPVLVTDKAWYSLVEGSRNQLDVHHGDLLEDIEYGIIDIAPYRYFFAVTEDDHYNTVLCESLKDELGSDHVYQLPVQDKSIDEEIQRTYAISKRDYCVLNSQKAIFENMVRRFYKGWEFGVKELSENFKYDDFLALQDDSKTLNFLVIRSNGRIQFFESEFFHSPEVGDKIVYYYLE